MLSARGCFVTVFICLGLNILFWERVVMGWDLIGGAGVDWVMGVLAGRGEFVREGTEGRGSRCVEMIDGFDG